MIDQPDESQGIDSVDSWSELIHREFVALDVSPHESGTFAGVVRSRLLGHMSVAEVSSVPQTFTRTDRLISSSPSELFQVGLIASGSGHLVQDGRSCDLTVGDFAVYETARPFRWRLAGDWKLLVFTWRRETMALDGVDSEQLTALRRPGDAGLSGIVSRTLSNVVDLREDVSAASAIQFAHEIAALTLTAAVEDRAQSPDTREDELMQKVLLHIEENLPDPLLNPQSIADNFFISPRTLHRLFASEGITVAHWIRTRRLEKCRNSLLAEPHVKITTLMARYGYFDLSQFSRNFSAQYGVSPSNFRARHF